jgi:tRNA threonylcarbamoyl adenosine modification protein (Sua5/YciO/YrdC/YwlC family)
MTTSVLKSDSSATAADVIRQASDVLRDGGLVAFPTETVYGLGARADHAAAMERLRAVKTREAEKAFTVHIASREDVTQFAPDLPRMAARLIHKAWPGPLTLIVTVTDPASVPAMAGRNGSAAAAMYYDNTVGLRCPDDAVAQAILRAVDAPIVASSANLHGEPPPWTGDDVRRSLEGRIDLIVDTGRTKYAKPSTIVKVTGNAIEVIREGVFDEGSIDRLSTVRFLFVCSGNTCRSPMAEKLAERILADKLGCGVDDLGDLGVYVSSAGTSGGFGQASGHAVQVMAQRGLDLSHHHSTALSADLVLQADHVLVMTRTHFDAVVRLAPTAKQRVQLVLPDDDVHDPVGGSVEDYQQCARTLEVALAERLREVVL